MPEQAVADSQGNWVDTKAPIALRPYLRLSRMDRPTPVWLLIIPGLWAIMLSGLATERFAVFDLWLIAGSMIGAFLMRGAGCTWNDITDRHIDAQVARTKSRPLPSGQVSVRGAIIWIALQCATSLLILLTFPPIAILLGILSIIPILVYPFAKRFTWWPQVFLGLAFNWGALLLWGAQSGSVPIAAFVLYAAGICWTIFYDTIYAYQDIEDDALIGVKSTARLFGDNAKYWLRGFQATTVVLMGLAVILACIDRSMLSLVVALAGPWAMGWHLGWQLQSFDTTSQAGLLRIFRSNREAGLICLPFFAVAAFL